jgi:hypothetical protein
VRLKEKSADYYLVPRTHNVTVLVLLPRTPDNAAGKNGAAGGNEGATGKGNTDGQQDGDSRKIAMLWSNQFVAAGTGIQAKPDVDCSCAAPFLRNAIGAAIADWTWDMSKPGAGPGQQGPVNWQGRACDLGHSLLMDDFVGFQDILRNVLTTQYGQTSEQEGIRDMRIAAMWHDLAAKRAEFWCGWAMIDLPRNLKLTAKDLPAADQCLSLLDDGSVTTAVLLSPKHLTPSDMSARLKQGKGDNPAVSLPADKIDLEASGNLRIAFPSLSAWGLAKDRDTFKQGGWVLEIGVKTDKREYSNIAWLPTPSPATVLKASAKVIDAAAAGTGEVRIQVNAPDPSENFQIKVDGADITDLISEPEGAVSKSDRIVHASGTVILKLENLPANDKIEVWGSAKGKADHPKLTFPVIQARPSPSN